MKYIIEAIIDKYIWNSIHKYLDNPNCLYHCDPKYLDDDYILALKTRIKEDIAIQEKFIELSLIKAREFSNYYHQMNSLKVRKLIRKKIYNLHLNNLNGKYIYLSTFCNSQLEIFDNQGRYYFPTNGENIVISAEIPRILDMMNKNTIDKIYDSVMSNIA